MAEQLKAELYETFAEEYLRETVPGLERIGDVIETPTKVFVSKETGEALTTVNVLFCAVGVIDDRSKSWEKAVNSGYHKYRLDGLSDEEFARYSAAFEACNDQAPMSESVDILHTSKHGARAFFAQGGKVDVLVSIPKDYLPENASFKDEGSGLVVTVELEDQSSIGPEPPLTEEAWMELMDGVAKVANRIIDHLTKRREEDTGKLTIMVHCSAGQSRSTLFIWLVKMILGRISVEGRFERNSPTVPEGLKRVIGGFDFQMDKTSKFTVHNALCVLQGLVEQRDVIALNPKWLPVMLHLARSLSTSSNAVAKRSNWREGTETGVSEQKRARTEEGGGGGRSSSSSSLAVTEDTRPLVDQWRRRDRSEGVIVISDNEEEEGEEEYDEEEAAARETGLSVEELRAFQQ